MGKNIQRISIVFLSSSYVNLAKLFAKNNNEYDVFLVLDRKFPQDFEDEELDNFYVFTFDNNKLFEKDKERYFDNLGILLEPFETSVLITNNFSKLLPKSFLKFLTFRNSKIQIINIHHGDLRILNEKKEMNYSGIYGWTSQFLEQGEFLTTIHKIENEKMDEGEQLVFSPPTTEKELKTKSFIHKKEEIINLRLKNVVLAYHERTKVLNLLGKLIKMIYKPCFS